MVITARMMAELVIVFALLLTFEDKIIDHLI